MKRVMLAWPFFIFLCGPLCFSVALCVSLDCNIMKNLHRVAQRTTEMHREENKAIKKAALSGSLLLLFMAD